MKNVLGVSGLYHDFGGGHWSKAADIIAAAQEERFTRRKHDRRFPDLAIEFCRSRLDAGQHFDAVAYYEDPVLSFDRVLRGTIDTAPASERAWQKAAVSQLTEKLAVLEKLRRLEQRAELFIVDHHMSHMASAYYPSPFEEAAIVVVDGVGEWATTNDCPMAGKAPSRRLRRSIIPIRWVCFYSAFHLSLRPQGQQRRIQADGPGTLWENRSSLI